MKTLRLLLLLPMLVLVGCASNKAVDEQQQAYSDPRDPLESVNRSIWDFNWEVLDKHILRPTTVAYVEYMPNFARKGLYNAALNLEEPASTLNNLLQGQVGDSATSLGRFLINSTIGLLGTIDVASSMGLERKDEEFGEVLGVWGVDNGPFLMLPAMGPSDVRNTAGDIVDSSYFALDSLNIYFSVLRAGIVALETRATLMQQEQLLDGAVDPYALVKDIYFQNEAKKVNEGEEVAPTAEEQELEDDIDAYLDDF